MLLLLLVVGCCWLLLVVVGCCWLLLVVVGCCWLLLVVGCWLLVVGFVVVVVVCIWEGTHMMGVKDPNSFEQS